MDSFIKFGSLTPFRTELKRRVEFYFEQRHLRKRDNVRLYLKGAFILLWTGGSYYFLVFKANNFWEVAVALLSLSLAIVGIGFNIQHDANHGGMSRKAWMNRIGGSTLDYFVGASSYLWKQKHNLRHHPYTNIPDTDEDINLSFMGRLAAEQKRYWFHRYQQFYLWGIYGFLPILYLYVDFDRVIRGELEHKKIPRPRGWDTVVFTVGKVVFLSLAFVVPFLLHPFWIVIVAYISASLLMGMIFSIVFQLAHMIEETEHPKPASDVESEWAIHQIRTTADFAPRNKILTWYLGGLNFQIEHHLFTDISHVHYPAISKIVQEVSKEYGIPYTVHRSFFTAIRSHYRFLKTMGQAA